MKELAEVLAARAIVGAARTLPTGAAERLGSLMGSVAHGLGARRAVVRRQIAASFPDRGPEWVERTAAACYRHYGREAVVMARMQGGTADGLEGRMVTDAVTEEWIARMAGGEGVIIVTGHLGNWETGGAYLARRKVPLSVVVKRQRNLRFDAWLTATRRRLGMRPVTMQDASRALPTRLGEGGTVALVADQDAGRRGLRVTFMGRPASTFRGPARLSLRTGAPLVFMCGVRDGDRYRLFLDVVRDRSPVAAASASEAERELTRRWVAMLERRVRERPEQYFWFHRRWKSGSARRNDREGATVPHAEARTEIGHDHQSSEDNGEAPS